jgi:hypothetical protein
MIFQGLWSEELDRGVHSPTGSHKIERGGMAKKRLSEWVCQAGPKLLGAIEG